MKSPTHYSNIPQTEKPMETFPQPRTIPDGWDMSDMFLEPEAGFDLTNTAESTEETGSDTWDNH